MRAALTATAEAALAATAAVSGTPGCVPLTAPLKLLRPFEPPALPPELLLGQFDE